VTYYATRHLGITADISGTTENTGVKINTTTLGQTISYDLGGVSFTDLSYMFGPTARFQLKDAKYRRLNFFARQFFGVSHLSIKSDLLGGCAQITTDSSGIFSISQDSACTAKSVHDGLRRRRGCKGEQAHLDSSSATGLLDNAGLIGSSYENKLAWLKARREWIPLFRRCRRPFLSKQKMPYAIVCASNRIYRTEAHTIT